MSTIDCIAAALVGIGPACVPALSRAEATARTAVAGELNNFMIIPCCALVTACSGRRCHGEVDPDQTTRDEMFGFRRA